MSGTEPAYSAPSFVALSQHTVLLACYAMSGTERAYGATSCYQPVCDTQYRASVSPYALAMQSPVLEFSGEVAPYARPTLCPVLMCRRLLSACVSPMQCPLSTLRACYAMPDTDIAYGATSPLQLRQYQVPIPYLPTREIKCITAIFQYMLYQQCRYSHLISQCTFALGFAVHCTVCHTNLAYSATRCTFFVLYGASSRYDPV
eukprot:1880201-Rhodomonas_salina.1